VEDCESSTIKRIQTKGYYSLKKVKTYEYNIMVMDHNDNEIIDTAILI